MKILLEHMYRDGAWVVISRTGTVLCPVKNLELHVNWCGLMDSDFTFCNLRHTSNGYKPRQTSKPLSYSTLRDLFKGVSKPMDSVDIHVYCLHVLRADGASAAANSGLKDILLKRHH